MPAVAEPLTLAEFDAACAAVDAARLELIALVNNRVGTFDLTAVLAELAARYPDAGDAHTLARLFLADCRRDGRPEAVGAAVLGRLDGLLSTIRTYPDRAADFTPAGFVRTGGLYWETRTFEFAGPDGTWHEYRLFAPAQSPPLHLAPLAGDVEPFAGGYVLGPPLVGGMPPFVSIAFIKRHTAEVAAHAAEVQARRDRAAEAAREQAERDREAARLARPLTVADLEAFKAEQQHPRGRKPAGATA